MRCFCPCFDEQDVDLDLEPVLLISGIGGSILTSKKNNKLGLNTRVWVWILLADLEFKKKLWSLYNPQTGYTETLDKDSQIVVPDDDYGLYAIDILDPSEIRDACELLMKDFTLFFGLVHMFVLDGIMGQFVWTGKNSFIGRDCSVRVEP